MHAIVRDAMLADPAIAESLGGRIHWADAPRDEAYPLAVLTRVSERRNVTLDGDVNLSPNLIQIDVYAEWHRDMVAAGEAVKKFWSALRSAEIAGAFVENIRESTEDDGGPQGRLYRASIDVLITIKE